jgi:hypothetical protein
VRRTTREGRREREGERTESEEKGMGNKHPGMRMEEQIKKGSANRVKSRRKQRHRKTNIGTRLNYP